MVQRKVPNKLCIPTDHLKSENRMGKLRPSSPRFQDGKNKGAEIIKKMKKAKSRNCSSMERSLKSPNFLKKVPQPGKPPPDQKQKQSPNYMRSTSSFESRKEKSQVSSHASIKIPKKDLKNSTITLNLGDKPDKTFTRTSSLKRVRTLTKAPSFKPTRSANKKCSHVVFCKDLTSERATCSSTLKDSKFPKYLKLSHGATESKGSSLMKVCPYTYCSLNGHRHAPLPPLKSFLSAKRRIWKTEKGTKLSCLSPRKTETSGDLEVENFGKIVVDVKDAIQEPKVQEDKMDFYIEIYAENKGVNSRIVSGCKGDGVVDRLSDETPKSRNELKNNLCDFNGTNFDTYDIVWEEGEHPAVDKIGYDCENSFAVSGNRPSCHNRNTFSISCFDEIPVDKKEKVFVQFGDEANELMNNNKDEVSTISVKLREESILLGNQVQYSNEPRQDEIHEDCESKTNNAQIFESDVCDVNVFVGYILADTVNSATKLVLEQETEIKQHVSNKSPIDILTNLMMRDGESNRVSSNRLNLDKKYKSKNFGENRNDTDINTSQARSFKSLNSNDSEDQAHLWLNKVVIAGKIISDADIREMSYSDSSDLKESFSAENGKAKNQEKTAYTQGAGRSSDDLQNNTINIQIIKCEKSEESLEIEREFNPREPNYLPIRPHPEAEKVDLRHQDMDDRKNAEEWMIDYALQQTVTRLAPARKRKVELLVEAFEKVKPPQYEPRLTHSYSVVTLARHIQACS